MADLCGAVCCRGSRHLEQSVAAMGLWNISLKFKYFFHQPSDGIHVGAVDLGRGGSPSDS